MLLENPYEVNDEVSIERLSLSGELYKNIKGKIIKLYNHSAMIQVSSGMNKSILAYLNNRVVVSYRKLRVVKSKTYDTSKMSTSEILSVIKSLVNEHYVKLEICNLLKLKVAEFDRLSSKYKFYPDPAMTVCSYNKNFTDYYKSPEDAYEKTGKPVFLKLKLDSIKSLNYKSRVLQSGFWKPRNINTSETVRIHY